MMVRASAACAGVVLCGVAAAQPGGAGGDRERSASLELEPRGSYMFEADLDDAGEYSVGRYGVGLSYRVPILEQSSLVFGLDAERSEYDFDGATGLAPGGDPIGGATAYELSARVVHPFDDEFSLLAGVSGTFAGEDGADLADSAQLGGIVAVNWKASEALTLTLGVTARDQLEDDVRVIPVVGIEWRIAENLRVSSRDAGRVFAGGGGGLGLVYESSEELNLIVGAGFNGRDYRLDEDGPIPDGVLRDDRVFAGVGLEWKPTGNVTALVGAGAVVWSNLETLDSGGSEIGDEDGDPAAVVSARVRIVF